MTFDNDGLTCWYDTPDAPAPPSTQASRHGVTLVVGVRPAHPSNVVRVRYRVDGQAQRELPARPLRTDAPTRTQYFQAGFPALPAGDQVDYVPILICAGRQAPAPGAERLVSSFRLSTPVVDQAPSPPAGGVSPLEPRTAIAPAPRFVPRLDFACRVTAALTRPPTVIGACPDGLRIDFLVDHGTAEGPGLHATIRPGGCDSMIIRRDGVGIVRLRAALQVDDGALIAAEYEGVFELGVGGYEKALLGVFPAQPPLTLAPRFFTAAPKYAWMNRVQFVGVGHVTMSRSLVEYDLFAAEGTWPRR